MSLNKSQKTTEITRKIIKLAKPTNTNNNTIAVSAFGARGGHSILVGVVDGENFGIKEASVHVRKSAKNSP